MFHRLPGQISNLTSSSILSLFVEGRTPYDAYVRTQTKRRVCRGYGGRLGVIRCPALVLQTQHGGCEEEKM